MASTGEVWKLGHRPALDGVRGIAILLVVLGHLGLWQVAPSTAAVGVAVFFTLSGYLITGILLAEHEHRGRVSLPRFFERRARRLLPALLAVVAFWLLWGGVDIRGTVSALTYWSNWNAAARGGPGADALHYTWSLSVEEQFYLCWPLLLLALRGRRRWVTAAAVAGSVMAVLLRVALWADGAGLWRIYYGSDTRADGLLIGCALAAALGGRRLLRAWAPVGLALILGACLVPDYGPGVFLWVPLVVSIGTALVIGSSRDTGFLTRPWLVWFGQRSYGLYLWHGPVHTVLHSAPVWVVFLAAVAVAELSWRFVEKPFVRRRRAETRTAGASEPMKLDTCVAS